MMQTMKASEVAGCPRRSGPRLVEAGLIAVAEVERDAARPQRTNYEEYTDGRHLRCRNRPFDMIAAPRRELPEFAAGLAYLAALDKDERHRRVGDQTRSGACRNSPSWNGRPNRWPDGCPESC